MPRSPAGAIRFARADCQTERDGALRAACSSTAGDSIRGATGRRCSICCSRRRTTAPGARAALAVPTFGKTGTSQDNRDALFVGFAGNLVVGVWVGRDDDKPLGKNVSGGTVPAQVWRNFMVPALALDGRVGPALPAEFHVPERAQPRRERQSPLPEEWSEGAEPLREIIREIEKLFE